MPKSIRNRIWKPDVSIKGAKHASLHSVVVDNQRMEIGPEGNIEYKVKMSTTLVCKMALASFPMDRQTCTLSMYRKFRENEILRFQFFLKLDFQKSLFKTRFSNHDTFLQLRLLR